MRLSPRFPLSLLLVAALLAASTTVLGSATAGAQAGAALPVAGVPDVIAAPHPSSAAIGCAQSAQRLTISSTSHLDPACVWTGGFDIVASDVVLDCQGALVQRVGGGRGIEIVTATEIDMADVTVRNCRVDGFLNNVRITRTGFRDLAEGVEYVNGLTGVVLEHNTFTNSHGVGVFVDGYVSDATIRHNRVEGAGSTGIYLETGSRRTTVDQNIIHDNGFRENGPGGQLIDLFGLQLRWWGIGREGLAIDGSYENTVTGNSFEGNSHGGVLLYTNCGEFPDSGRWFDRRWPSDRNVIDDNTFAGGLNGVWVGQRMAENTFPMECTKPAYDESPLRSVTLDFAADNTVSNNHFVDVTYPVRVEDDGTTVEGNTIIADSPAHHGIIIGTEFRTTVLNRPVRTTTIRDNAISITGNDDPIRWVHGYDGLTVEGNSSNGTPTGICEGVQPPRLGLIWTITAVIEPVGSPVTPTPDDISHPVLGEVAPCAPVDTPVVAPGLGTAIEGTDAIVRIPVTLSAAADRTVRLDWRTATLDREGFATMGADATPASGQVVFDPGVTQQFIDIEVLDDADPENDEYVVVQTGHAHNAVLGGFYGLGFGSIADDDGPAF